MIYENFFLISLLFTVIIETIALFFLVKKLKIKSKLSRTLFLGIFASFATLPYLWFILPMLIKNYYILMIIGEISVFLVETVIYCFGFRINAKKALIISLICNLMSFLLGLLLF